MSEVISFFKEQNRHKVKKAILWAVSSLLLIIAGVCVTIARYPADEWIPVNTIQSFDEAYILDSNGEKHQVSAGDVVSDVADTLEVYVEADEKDWEKGVFMVQNVHQHIQISLDGALLYQVGRSDDKKPTSINEFIVVRLPEDPAVRTLKLTYYNLRHDQCDIGPMFFGTPSEIFTFLVLRDIFSLLILVLLFMLFLFVTAFVVVQAIKKTVNYMLICLMALLSMMLFWVSSNMWVSTLLPVSDMLLANVSYAGLMCLMVPVGYFAYCATLNKKYRFLIYGINISVLVIVCQQLAHYVAGISFYDMLIITHGTMFALTGCCLYAHLLDYRENKTLQGAVLLGTFITPFVTVGISASLFWLFDNDIYMLLYLIGMLIFVFMLILDAVFALVESNFKSRQTQMELEVYQTLSVKDGLTGLGNRRSFDEMLIEVEANDDQKDTILFFLDINGLKSVNDTFGHESGDELIKGAANVVAKAFGGNGICFRLGGDEFAAIVENPSLPDEVYFSLINEQIRIYNMGRQVQLSMAMGCDHLYNKDGIRRSMSLWKSNADREMYADKMRAKMMVSGDVGTGILPENMDALTGILNLEGFRKAAQNLIWANRDRGYSLWHFNIKRFKFVNDFFGYEMGDKVICYLANVLYEAVAECETCGRVNADEFVALLRFHNHTDMEERFRHIASHLEDFLKEEGIVYTLELSAGIYILKMEDLKSPNINQMLDWANVANKSLKGQNGSRFCIFGEEMWEQQFRELFISQSLDEALANGEICVWFQPQYDFATGRMCGAEALCRWTHHAMGWISPGEFIPVLERTGQIVKLDRYVWEESCKYMRRWRNAKTMIPISVSVNVSRMEMGEGNLVDRLNMLTDKYSLPHSALRLEITETGYMNEPEVLIEAVNDLHDNGYTVEMDDFGSGFSSLNMLKDVSVDVLKMDMRFIQGEDQRKKGGRIVKAIVGMSQELGITVLTEGVETLEQARYLASIGCTRMQGYYFSKPIPPKALEELLRQEKVKINMQENQVS